MQYKFNFRGFSFTEALVVVVSIMILTGITVASFSRAKEYSRITRCISNLHRLSLAAIQYAQSNQGQYPRDYQTNRGYWCSEIKSYDASSRGDRMCPDALEPSEGVGSASKAWGGRKFDDLALSARFPWLAGVTSSYGLNGDLAEQDVSQYSPMAQSPFLNAPLGAALPRQRARLQPNEPLFADAIWVDGSPRRSDAIPQSLQYGDANLSRKDQMGVFCVNRHFGRINVSFVDGSAFTVPLAQLWQLKWNAAYRPRDVVVPVTW